jgi:ankyrin repeat protein
MSAAHERPALHDDGGSGSHKRPRLASSASTSGPSLGAQLIAAAQHGELERVNSLVERGASLRATEKGKSALDYAVKSNDLPMVECLLGHGADPTFDGLRNSGAGRGAPPIVSAARRGNVAILRTILAASADVNQAGGIGQTALHTAAYYGHNSFVAALLTAGAVVDPETTYPCAHMPNDRGPKTKIWKCSTPLHLAASAGHTDVIQTLLRAGSRSLNGLTKRTFPQDFDQDGVFTPLHLAVESSNLGAIKTLVHAGALLHTAGSYKGTAFDWAVYTRNIRVMALMALSCVLTPAHHLSLCSRQPGKTEFGWNFLLRVKLEPVLKDRSISEDDLMDHETATLLAGLWANATYPAAPLAVQAAELRLAVRRHTVCSSVALVRAIILKPKSDSVLSSDRRDPQCKHDLVPACFVAGRLDLCRLICTRAYLQGLPPNSFNFLRSASTICQSFEYLSTTLR